MVLTGRIRGIITVALLQLSLISSSSSSPTPATTLAASVPTSISIQKSVSFEARDSKTWRDEPIIMEMLTKDSYFPAARAKSKSAPSPKTTVPTTTTTTEAPTEVNNPSANDVAGEAQASSMSYSTSSNPAWTPIPQNSLPLTAQPMYYPAPGMYGYSVNHYGPPVINFGGGPPSPVSAFGGVKPLEASQLATRPFYNIPVKSVEYIPQVIKPNYAPAVVEKLPQYNAVRVPYERPAEADVASSYGAPVAQAYGLPATSSVYVAQEESHYDGPGQAAAGALASPVGAAYGPPAGEVQAYGPPPQQVAPYGPPPPEAPVYGPPPPEAPVYGPPPHVQTTVKKNVHNVHQKVLHRYNHHQKVLHEHNLHRYIIHNYHLHRYHVHNIHQEKEHIHVHKDHVHEKFQQKETEEHKTKETKGETHKHVTEVKESQRHLPPVHAPMHVVKPQWSVWG